MKRIFVETPIFTQKISSIGSDEILKEIQGILLENPEEGATIAGTGGVRKMRAKDPSRGKGKRGGLRVLYLDLADQSLIYLIYLYGKDEAEDLTHSEKREFKELVKILKE
jgi:hypothetical protein